MKTLLPAFALAVLAASAQSFVPQQARDLANEQNRYANERNFYQRGAYQAEQSYQRCQTTNRSGDPYRCEPYRQKADYYRQMEASMRSPVQAQQQQQLPSQRPIADYPFQNMFPGPGQVAAGVVNGIVTGQTTFPTNPNQMLQQPPVNYQNAMGGYAAEMPSQPAGSLPYGGFQQYSQQPSHPQYQRQRPQAPQYTQPRVQPYQPRQQRPPQQGGYTNPQQPQQPQVWTYPPYNGYPARRY